LTLRLRENWSRTRVIDFVHNSRSHPAHRLQPLSYPLNSFHLLSVFPGDCEMARRMRELVGSVIQLKDKDAAMRATSALRREINMANIRGKGNPLPSPSWPCRGAD
jgi:hypothetical protein